jgi:cytochrome c551/c552
MKQANRRSTSAFKLIAFALAFIFSLQLQAQGDPAKGKTLFKANCTACHKMESKLVGPALKGVTEKREAEWLKKWIKDSQALVKSGDADAKAIFDEYKIPMTAYPNFSDADLDNIIAYMANPKAASTKKTTAPAGGMPANVKKGKDLFKANCTACHKLDGKLVGPGLRNIADKREKEWLHKWIKDSQALVKSGDADAKAIFDEYKIPMTAYPNFSAEDIDAILAYTSYVAPKKAAVSGTTDAKKDVVVHKTDMNPKKTNLPLWILLALFVAIAVVSKSKKAKALLFPLVAASLLLGAWVTYEYLMQIGVDQGYQPVQPIKFSHRIHAGDNGIDCQYCHSSAKDGKTSGIPSINVCNNCHSFISEVAEDTRIGNYGKKELDSVLKVVREEHIAKKKPIAWVRIHKLPDFVYYNHSQHVSVQGLACQTCHGEVEKMDEVYQAKPLTMKWCVDCHRTTDVKMDNKYYEDIHKEMSKKYNKKTFTEADMGGLECAKCHY